MSFTKRLLAAGFAVSIALSSATALSTVATTSHAAPISVVAVANAENTQQAADWIVAQWNDDSSSFNAGLLSDSILALVASESNQSTVEAMIAQLTLLAPEYATSAGATGKVALAVEAAGLDPRSFGGLDLIADLKTQLAADPSAGSAFGQSLAILGLTRAGETLPQAVLDAAIASQGNNGAFGYVETWNNNNFVSDPDATAMMIAALLTVDDPQAEAAVDKAVAWAATAKQADGSWPGYSPANSTGLMAAALDDAGVDVSDSVAWLKGQQLSDGGFAASLGGTTSNSMATTQAILGLAQVSYATVKQVSEEPTATPTDEPTATPTEEPTATPTEEPSSSATATPEPTSTGTSQPSATDEPTQTAAPTSAPTSTGRPSTLPSTGAESGAGVWLTTAFVVGAAGVLVARRR